MVRMKSPNATVEFNNTYLESLTEKGLRVCGTSLDGKLVEAIEIPGHPWFLACQFHPEFTSTPRRGHPLFTSFVEAARTQAQLGTRGVQ